MLEERIGRRAAAATNLPSYRVNPGGISFEAGTERLFMTFSGTTLRKIAFSTMTRTFRPRRLAGQGVLKALTGLAVLTVATVANANDHAGTAPLPVKHHFVQSEAAPPAAPGQVNPPLAGQDFFRLRRPPGQPSETPQDRGQRDTAPDDDGPGCPANQRPLDLLV